MAWKATIGGVDKTTSLALTQPIQISRSLNERATARFVTKPGYVPARFDTVALYDTDGTTALFGGVVLKRSIDPFRQRGGSEPYFTQIECGDYFTYFDWAFVSLTYSSPVSLETVIDDLIAALPVSYGITKDAGQVTGPTLSEFSWVRKRASDAVRELTDRTGYVATLSPLKVFKMFVPGTDAAPFTLTDAGPRCQTFSWQDTDQVPANAVTVFCGPSSGAFLYEGTRTQAGGATSWQFDLLGSTDPWAITVDGTPKTVTPIGGGGQYEWDHDTYTLHTGTDGTPANGSVFVVTYWVDYPFPVRATSGATPVIEVQRDYPGVLTFPQGAEVAAGLLAQLNQQPREAAVTSLSSGWAPGQALTVALTARMTASFVLTMVGIALQVLRTTQRWVYEFRAIESSTYAGSYLDGWRILTGGAGGASGGGDVVITTVTTAPSPVYMGGSYTQSVTDPSTKKLIQGAVPFVATADFTGRLRVNLKARDAGVGVKATISDGTTDTSTSIVTSQTFTDTSVVVSIVSGHTYWVYIQNNATGDGYVGYAQLEAA